MPGVRGLHARGLLLPAAVLLAAAAVLLHGALNRDPVAQAADTFTPRPAPRPLPPIRVDLEKTPLTYFADYWRQLGEGARPKFVPIGARARAAVVVAPGLALTSLDAADDWQASQAILEQEQEALRDFVGPLPEPAAQQAAYRLAAIDSDLGVALFELSRPYPASNFSIADPSSSPPGSFVATIALPADQRLSVTPAHLSSAAGDELAISSAPASVGGAAAVVDLDGRLLGLLVDDGDSSRILSSDAVLDLVDRHREGRPCLAISVGELSPDVATALRLANGVVIESIRASAFDPEPSLRPGDVITEWDREPIESPAQFESLYVAGEAGSLSRYAVLRAGRRVTGGTKLPDSNCLPAASPPAVFAVAGITVRWEESDGRAAWQVLEAELDSPAGAAVAPGDWVLAVNGRSSRRGSLRALEGFGEGGDPLILMVESGGRVQLRAIESASE